MATSDIEMTKQHLTDLNKKIGEMEQQQGEEATEFFEALLSDQLIFRRASGKVVGKSGPEGEGFMDGLTKPSAFTDRVSKDISVGLFDNRALVTLVVVGTRADGSVGNYQNIRLFTRSENNWILELWYNYEIST